MSVIEHTFGSGANISEEFTVGQAGHVYAQRTDNLAAVAYGIQVKLSTDGITWRNIGPDMAAQNDSVSLNLPRGTVVRMSRRSGSPASTAGTAVLAV